MHPSPPPKLTLHAANLKIDLFRSRRYVLPGGDPLVFDEIFERRQTIARGDLRIEIPCIDDLIRTRMLRDSPKDREDLRYLESIRESIRKDPAKDHGSAG